MPVEIRSGAGLIRADIYKPQSESMGLVILLPGFLQHRQTMSSLGEAIARYGYTSIAFDPRGTLRSSEIGKYTTSNFLEDIDRVREFIEKKEEGKINRVLLCGHSYGGWVSILVSSSRFGISATVALMPPNRFGDTLNTEEKEKWKRTGSIEIRRRKIPYTIYEDSLRYADAEDAVTQITSPLLLIAGGKDKLISDEKIALIRQKAAGPTKSITIFEADHLYFKNPQQSNLVNRAIIEWLREIDS